jgi:uncharacterized membrane protein
VSSESDIFTVARTAQGTQGEVVQSAEVGLRTRETIYMPAAEFKGYSEILPDAAERLLTLFEEQTRHRMAVENRQIQNEREISENSFAADQANRTRAFKFGLSALLIFVALSVFFAFMRMEGAAIAAILVPAIQCIGDWIGKLIRDRKNANGKSSEK